MQNHFQAHGIPLPPFSRPLDFLSSRTQVVARSPVVTRRGALVRRAAVYTKSDVGLVAPDSNLQSLLTFSELVHDSKGDALKFGKFGENAATVSAGVLMAALKSNDTSDVGAIEGAMAYDECDSDHCETEDERLQCVIDKAFVNLGANIGNFKRI